MREEKEETRREEKKRKEVCDVPSQIQEKGCATRKEEKEKVSNV